MSKYTEGRQYHGDAASTYPLPNDDRERLRLRQQHDALLALMHLSPIHAPLGNLRPQRVLDIGCGVNADMTIYLAKMFPTAEVIGVDLSPVSIPQDLMPPNAQFIQGNVRSLISSHERLKPGTFDYVYSRLIVGDMDDWEPWIANIVTPLLAPGGWLEVQDQDHLDWYDEHDNLISDAWPWVQHFSKFWTVTRGNRFHQLRDQFPEICSKAGLAAADTKEYRLPWAPIPGKPETELYGKYGPELVDAFTNAICSVFRGEENAKLREELSQNCHDTLQSKPGMWTPFYVGWAQKPAA